jgi:hypothetical protein
MKFLETCSPNFQKFFDWSKQYLAKHDKKVFVVNTKTVKMDGVRCGGWCEDDKIVVAFKSRMFEETYTHEFSHMQQNVQNSPYWTDTSLFWRHLAKDKVAMNSWDSVLAIIALERDCERRALKHSENWNLFDNADYAKHANIYLHFYQYVFLKRKWNNSTNIYRPELLELMPEKLKPISSFANIDMKLMGVFEECLGKRKKLD